MGGHRVLLKAVTVFMMALAFGFFCGTTSRAYGIQYDFQPVSEIRKERRRMIILRFRLKV